MLMTTNKVIDLSGNKVAEPYNAHRVESGKYAMAEASQDFPYLLTYGLVVCKGIVITPEGGGKGLMAHLSRSDDFSGDLDTIASGYDGDIGGANITIVETGTSKETGMWPGTDYIAKHFDGLKSNSISVDRNEKNSWVRGIVLELETGVIREIEGEDGWSFSPEQRIDQNQRIRAI